MYIRVCIIKWEGGGERRRLENIVNNKIRHFLEKWTYLVSKPFFWLTNIFFVSRLQGRGIKKINRGAVLLATYKKTLKTLKLDVSQKKNGLSLSPTRIHLLVNSIWTFIKITYLLRVHEINSSFPSFRYCNWKTSLCNSRAFESKNIKTVG